jgi:hypothetical protein
LEERGGLISGDSNGNLKIWSFISGEIIKAFNDFTESVGPVVSIDNNNFFACCDGKNIRIYNLGNWILISI